MSDLVVKSGEMGPGRSFGPLAEALRKRGALEDALRVVEELKRTARTKYVAPPVMVRAYASLGDREQAMVWMRKAYDGRCNETPRVPLWGPVVASLRSYPPYEELLMKIKISQR